MKTLFDTTHIGNMSFKNRFVRAAIGEKTTNRHANKTGYFGMARALAEEPDLINKFMRGVCMKWTNNTQQALFTFVANQKNSCIIKNYCLK
jgi:2,4-dienoyl-CoA reductase-like NADH-dependent reductase (Old Yellow Enzyme family)